jgi:hypothetical protein
MFVTDKQAKPINPISSHMKPEAEIKARLLAVIKAYSALLSEAETDQENQSQQQHEQYRYDLHMLEAERKALLWVLDLNNHNQPTGEHLVREAKDIINPS